MTYCGAIQEGHGPHTHTCVGEQGHPGHHWCLLGHGWPADETTSEEAS